MGGTRDVAEERCEGRNRALIQRCDHLGECVALGSVRKGVRDAIELAARSGPVKWPGMKAVIIVALGTKHASVLLFDFEIGREPVRELR
ncbi:hypothetical protein ACVWXO_002116 [Bradyrhizobium sp. LM2.7]